MTDPERTTHDDQPADDQPPPRNESGRPSPALLLFAIFPVIGIAIALAMLAAEPGGTTATSDITPPPVVRSVLRNPAVDFELTTLDGSTATMSDYAGRVVFLNFWHVNCPPCIRELPALQQFADEQGDDGAVVLAVNPIDTPEQVTAFLIENDITLDDVPVLMDSDAFLYRRYGIQFFPTTYVINPDGIVSDLKFGEVTVDDLYDYVELATSEG